MFATADCPAVKIDSNFTGLRYAWERCLRQLPVEVEGQEEVIGVAASVVFEVDDLAEEDETITIDGVELAFKLTITNPATQVQASIVNPAAQASVLASSLNTVFAANAPLNGYTASAAGTTVTIYYPVVGETGNGTGFETATTAIADNPAMFSGGVDFVAGIEAIPAPEWRVIEPNSYSDMGATINTVARNPIRPNRQRRKGRVTGVDASAGFNMDLTYNSSTDLMQGFCFALARQKWTTQGLNEVAAPLFTGTGGPNDYTAPGDKLDILSGFGGDELVFASGFTNPSNNGLKTVVAVGSGGGDAYLQVAETTVVDGAQPAEAKISKVGFKANAGDLAIVMSGSLVRLTSAGQIWDAEMMGLILGEWIFIGGDGANNAFDDNIGFARISAIDPDGGYLEFDKVTWPEPSVESGAGKTIHVYFGTVIRSEPDPADIVRGSLQLERTLGLDADGTMSEYTLGCVPNELTLNVAQEDKVTVDMSFIACDAEHRTGAQGLKDGTRPPLQAFDAYNTSSDFVRIKLSAVSDVDANPIPLFAYATDLSVSINNNGSPNKAVGHVGAIDISNGDFEVGGELTAYFASVAAVQAVRNNADITLDAIMVFENKGLLYDIPLLSLGNGRLAVEKDQAITLPLETSAAESKFGHTLLFQSFEYLPDLASVRY